MRWLTLAALALLLAGCTAGAGDRTPEPPAMSRSASPAAPVPLGPDDWPTYHHDNARSGVAARLAPLTALSPAWTARLDGAVYGQPLVVGDRVLAATENDTVYALNRADGRVLWSQHLGTPESLAALPCGNIDPLGITGTAAYDAATGQVFVVAETQGGHHSLVGVDLHDGQVTLRRPVEPPRGTARDHQQRAALTVLDDWVYLAYGGLDGDCGSYVGSVVAAPTSGLGPMRTVAVPTPGKGGIWAPGGATVRAGTLFYAVGNGDSTTDYDHSDAILAVTPDLRIADGFSPAEWAADNEADLDLGSMSPAVVGGHVVAAGKRGVGYLLDAAHLGGIGGAIQQFPACRAFGGSAVDGATVYLPCADRTRALAVDDAGHATVRWTAAVPSNGSPVVGGGAVWTVDTARGRLSALDAATGVLRAAIDVGALPHFASPTLAGDAVYLGTMSGVVAVSGA